MNCLIRIFLYDAILLWVHYNLHTGDSGCTAMAAKAMDVKWLVLVV